MPRVISFLLIIVLLLCYMPVHVKGNDSVAIESSWKATLNYLSWTKFWFGQFFDEKCYLKLVGKEIPVTFSYTFNMFAEIPESSKTNECDTMKRKKVFRNIGNVHINGTNVLFKLRGLSELTTRPYKFRASIVIGFLSDNKCTPSREFISILNSPPVNERERDLARWTMSFSEKKVIPDIDFHSIRELHEGTSHSIVSKAVKRSMTAYLKRYYFEKPLPGQYRRDLDFTPELLEKVKKNRKILVGKYTEKDPEILVYFEGDNEIYCLDFPKIEILSNECYCMEVYPASPYLGYDIPYDKKKSDKIMHHLLEKLKTNSIELMLPAFDT